mmetsp:Transcript_132072/g.329432  ORF Transcript_132072/g.329432 Transcript_132072/m.329432 type:complete len:230 (-) Transcript_132072:916-1605(-)
MIAWREQTASISSTEWLVMTMAAPPATASRKPLQTASRAPASIPVVGSSRRTTRGWAKSAAATESFRRLPPLRRSVQVLRCGSKSILVIKLSTEDCAVQPDTPRRPATMCKTSSTVKRSGKASTWGQYPILRRAAVVDHRMLKPSTEASPSDGKISPASIRKAVVLPAPFSPKRPKDSPRKILACKPRTACTFCRRWRNCQKTLWSWLMIKPSDGSGSGGTGFERACSS